MAAYTKLRAGHKTFKFSLTFLRASAAIAPNRKLEAAFFSLDISVFFSIFQVFTKLYDTTKLLTFHGSATVSPIKYFPAKFDTKVCKIFLIQQFFQFFPLFQVVNFQNFSALSALSGDCQYDSFS